MSMKLRLVVCYFAIIFSPLDSLAAPQLAPYFPSGIAGQGRTAARGGDWKAAVEFYRKALSRKYATNNETRKRLRFLLAHALLRARQYGEAAVLFESLVDDYPLLADYHRHFAAKATYRARDFRKSLELAASVRKASAIYNEAALLRADALRALGEEDRSAPIWVDYLERNSRGRRRGKAHHRLANIYLKRARTAAERSQRHHLRNRALNHYLDLLAEAPLSRYAGDAKKGVLKLTGKKKPALSPEQLYTRAHVFYRRMRNRKSEIAFDQLLKRSDLSDKRRCQSSYYRAKSVFKARKRVRAAPLFEAAISACSKSGSTDLEIKSIYNRGRGLFRKGDYSASAEEFLSIGKRFPKHSYADDGQLRAAEAFAEAKDNSRVRIVLNDIPTRFPKGDMAREALWRLAKMDYLAGDYSTALVHLNRIIDKLGHATIYYAEGRALYWKARTQGKLRQRKKSLATYENTVRQYPLSYYALQALNRLRELDRKRFQRLRRTLINPIGKNAGRWKFGSELKPYFRKAHIKRGIELARLGFSRFATVELSRGGLSTNKKTSKAGLWLAALLFDRAKAYHLSHRIPRRKERSFKREYPLKENVLKWKIAFPKAFPAAVRKNAKRSGIPEYLVWAIMREESGFVAHAESYANAIGLMQMILPTARAAGKRRKTRVTRKTLQQPAVNIKLGAAFLGWLNRNLSGVLPLVIASYNAGQGATYRWLKEFGKYDLDELLEQIPYDQTRRYTKRVLSSLFTYSVLYHPKKDIPRIIQKLPTRGKTRF